ncbi:hypothetical protein CGRA01v4_07626 [Colletotrichum graminicola]|nr:hypothetical protein CGRA01v4_07626 [Colletotrichum graminicola]
MIRCSEEGGKEYAKPGLREGAGCFDSACPVLCSICTLEGARARTIKVVVASASRPGLETNLRWSSSCNRTLGLRIRYEGPEIRQPGWFQGQMIDPVEPAHSATVRYPPREDNIYRSIRIQTGTLASYRRRALREVWRTELELMGRQAGQYTTRKCDPNTE